MKTARSIGSDFENEVRKDLESKGWFVSKWNNTVVFDKLQYSKLVDDNIKTGKLIHSKPKYNPITKSIMYVGTGFPDFIVYRLLRREKDWWYICPKCSKRCLMKEICCGEMSVKQGIIYPIWQLTGVECKSNGYLSKEEKEKCKWMLDNNVFSKILIAKKDKKEIIYNEFK